MFSSCCVTKEMKIAFFSSKTYDKESFTEFNHKFGHELTFFETHLNELTVKLAHDFDAVCVFVNDQVNAKVITELAKNGVKLILLRCAGFNNVDLEKAKECRITVLRVPAYSPYAVAEHAVALMLALNRKIHKAYNKVRDGNFSLEGLLGFDMYGKTAGIIGTGKIGAILCRILKHGFMMNVVAYDVIQSKEVIEMGIKYVSLDELYAHADIISLHVPLLPSTNKMINKESIQKMKPGVMLINTSRGQLIDTVAIIDALKSKRIGYLGLDVYEEEADYFFEDLSGSVIQDDNLMRLTTFSNVLLTAHQAFFTRTALEQISTVTLTNAADFARGSVKKENEVTAQAAKPPAEAQARAKN